MVATHLIVLVVEASLGHLVVCQIAIGLIGTVPAIAIVVANRRLGNALLLIRTPELGTVAHQKLGRQWALVLVQLLGLLGLFRFGRIESIFVVKGVEGFA